MQLSSFYLSDSCLDGFRWQMFFQVPGQIPPALHISGTIPAKQKCLFALLGNGLHDWTFTWLVWPSFAFHHLETLSPVANTCSGVWIKHHGRKLNITKTNIKGKQCILAILGRSHRLQILQWLFQCEAFNFFRLLDASMLGALKVQQARFVGANGNCGGAVNLAGGIPSRDA